MVICQIQEGTQWGPGHVETMPGVLSYQPKNNTPEQQQEAVKRCRERVAKIRARWLQAEREGWPKK